MVSPLKFQREKPVQGFLTPDCKPGNSASEARGDDLIPEDKEFVVVHWHSAVNVIERHWQCSQRICCLDLDPVRKPFRLRHDTRLGRVNAAKMSNELMDKEIIILKRAPFSVSRLAFFNLHTGPSSSSCEPLSIVMPARKIFGIRKECLIPPLELVHLQQR